MTDTLDVIHRLLEDGKHNQFRVWLSKHGKADCLTIEKIDLINDKTLGKRWDVPGLDCGSTRALRK